MVSLPDAIDEHREWEERLKLSTELDGGKSFHFHPFTGIVALTRNHKTAASVIRGGAIAVWDAASRKVRHTLTGHRKTDSVGGGIESLVFSPSGRQLAAGTSDERVEIWEIP